PIEILNWAQLFEPSGKSLLRTRPLRTRLRGFLRGQGRARPNSSLEPTPGRSLVRRPSRLSLCNLHSVVGRHVSPGAGSAKVVRRTVVFASDILRRREETEALPSNLFSASRDPRGVRRTSTGGQRNPFVGNRSRRKHTKAHCSNRVIDNRQG